MPQLEPVPPSAAADLVPKKPGKSSYDRVETHPGLDTFAVLSDSELRERCLGPLLAWARAVVPQRVLHTVPLFLFATAGEDAAPPLTLHPAALLAASKCYTCVCSTALGCLRPPGGRWRAGP